MSDASSDSENVPAEVLQLANQAKELIIPPESKHVYDRAYTSFQEWKQKNKCKSNRQDVILGYLVEHFENKTWKPPTLWAQWAMLKATLYNYDEVETSTYLKVAKFIKTVNKGYKPKKSKILTPEQVSKFIVEAPDHEYLATQV